MEGESGGRILFDEHRINDVEKFLEPYGFAEDLRNMIVLDAVILNPDRHLGNFGFIVDNETYKVLWFAPVFDHNRQRFQEQ